MGVLRALQHKLPTSILFMLYNNLIYPYLQYCNIAWAPHLSIANELFILQKKALRIICKVEWKAHTTSLFRNLGTLKFADINKLQTCCFMFKAMHNQLPPLFNNYFTLNYNIHDHFTRQAQGIHLSSVSTSLRKFSIKHFGSTLWNSLPAFLKSKPSIYSFSKAYKQFILATYI